ncbi:hypothetical protein [Streptacidiphilus melanogenes]|uniref:hypothetical protein n=1 Tax=Streptacidiphilus melanogenes TaxID=411235 RepID=UPI0005AAD2FB|nr:hypothetical protein [Streptacidiphilus melanogenes]
MSTCDCPPPDRDLCPDCRGWGYQPGTSGKDHPLCARCPGHGGQTPHDLGCRVWGPVVLAPGPVADPQQ